MEDKKKNHTKAQLKLFIYLFLSELLVKKKKKDQNYLRVSVSGEGGWEQNWD